MSDLGPETTAEAEQPERALRQLRATIRSLASEAPPPALMVVGASSEAAGAGLTAPDQAVPSLVDAEAAPARAPSGVGTTQPQDGMAAAPLAAAAPLDAGATPRHAPLPGAAEGSPAQTMAAPPDSDTIQEAPSATGAGTALPEVADDMPALRSTSVEAASSMMDPEPPPDALAARRINGPAEMERASTIALPASGPEVAPAPPASEAAAPPSGGKEVTRREMPPAMADAPILRAGAVSGAEDSAVSLDLAAMLADQDGSETLSVTLLGVPAGATLSAGTRQADGSWSLAATDLTGLTLTPPPDFAGRINLTLRAISTETANGATATVERDFTVAIRAVVDGGAISGRASGAEDSAIPLAILFGPLSDASERWDEVVTIRGVPPDSSLSAGDDLGDGVWRVDRAALAAGRIAITPAADSDAPIALMIETRIFDAGGVSALVSTPLTVTVAAMADLPEAAAMPASGEEDVAIPLRLVASLLDSDGSESLTLAILGVPAGAVLSAGVRDAEGNWRVSEAELEGLSITPPPEFSGEMALIFRATATEAANQHAVTRDIPFTVQVAPRVEAGAMLSASGSGAEDGWISIAAAFVTPDGDGSEALAATVLIEGMPDGAILSHGSPLAGGAWQVPTAELLGGRIALRPPVDADAAFSLRLSVTLTDSAGSSAESRSVTAVARIEIAAVADAPLVELRDAAGLEDRAIALEIGARLADLDGSETLSVVLIGVPEGAVLSAGARLADGSWDVPVAALPSLSLTPPPDFAGQIALTLRATSTEAANGASASTEQRFTIHVAPVLDGAGMAASASGLEDRVIPILVRFDASSDASEQWDASAVIRGVPPGAALSTGTDLGGGAWRVDRAALAAGGIAITPPPQSDAPIPLTIEAVLRDGDGAGVGATLSIPVTVTIAALADAPLTRAADVTGAEDHAIALDLDATLADLDGSETLSVTLLGVPAGATLSAGVREADGSWSLPVAALPGLTLTPPADFAGQIALTLRATSTEARGGDSATTLHGFTVTVAPRADMASLTASGDGAEDGWIAIRGMLATTDRDGSETLGAALTISGVPQGAVLSHGTEITPGTWSVLRAVFENGTLAIHPPVHSDADIPLTITARTQDGADTRDTSITATIIVRAVADAPLVQVANAAGQEDTAIRLAGLGGMLTDMDGSETLSFSLHGLPAGASLTAGTRQADGSWTLTPAQLESVSLRPPAHFAGSVDLILTAVAREARDGAPTARSAASFRVVVDPVADAGSISGSQSGDEDGWIGLRPSFSTPDQDGSERWSALTRISGIPAGAILNRGEQVAPGEWDVATADLRANQVSIRPPADSDRDFSLMLRATLSDSANGMTVTREITGSHAVIVRAVADAPLASAVAVTGAEDNAIALRLSAALSDTDGSETLALVILGVPAGATLSAGTRNADGSWSVTAAQLPDLSLTPPRDFAGAIALTLRATARESDGGNSAIVDRPFTVTVEAVADTPVLRTGPAIGGEDSAIALRISATATDQDGSERIAAFRILDLPQSAVLRAGGAVLAREPDGSVLVDAAAAATLNLTPPPQSDADFTLRVTAIATEANGSRAESAPRELAVRVDAVADAPVWLRLGADGAEDAPIPLQLAAQLADADGSEQLFYVISGVPTGATLSAGSWRGPGSWSLTAEEAANVTLTPPRDFSGSITLTASAVAQEANGGAQALATVSFPVRVAAMLDTTNWWATARGAEDAPIAVNLAAPLRDRDGSERMVGEAVVEGVPVGAVLRLADGTVVPPVEGVHRIAVDRLGGVTLTLPRDSDAAVELRVRVAVEDTGGVRGEVTGVVVVAPLGVADAPGLGVEHVMMKGHDSTDGAEGWEALPVKAALADTDGSEALHLWIRDVPAGFALSAGTPAGEGAWLLRAEDLDGLRIRPPAGYGGAVKLRVQAVAVEANGDTAVTTLGLAVEVTAPPGGDAAATEAAASHDKDAAADMPGAPYLEVAPDRGQEDEAVAIAVKFGIATKDATHGILISGVPAGARLSQGVHDSERDVWVLRPEELEGLRLSPPADFAGSIKLSITAFAIGPTGAATSTTRDVALDFEAVADGPAIAAAPSAAAEDRVIPLNLAITGSDADGSEEVVSVTLSGLSPGASIAPAHGIVAHGDGSWTVAPEAVSNIRLVPPENAHGVFGLTVTATVREASNGATSTRSRGVSVAVAPVADAPAVSASDAAGLEDSPIALGLAAALVDRDGSEVLSVVLAGLPSGARLSAGINNGDGSWTLAPAQLAGLTVTPPAEWSGTMALTLHAHAIELSTGAVASTSVPFRVSVAGVADAPLVDAATGATGLEDSAIALDILARLTDRDGSETLTLAVSGVPEGAGFSAGSRNPDGSWTIPGAAIAGLAFTPPAHFAGTLRLGFAATATEQDGAAAATRFEVTLTVDAVADAPTLSFVGLTTAEDVAIRLPLAATLTDQDGSESIARFVVAGLPPGATLSAGTRGADGSWTLTPADAEHVMLRPPANFAGRLDLTVTAVSREGSNGAEAQASAPLAVTITPVADAPNLFVLAANGAEDTAIRLPVAATLVDTDGSESIARFVVTGLPAGATLTAGTRGTDGSWTLTSAEAANVSMTTAAHWSGSVTLGITVVSRETATGEEASRSATLPVTVAAVADAASLAATPVMGVEDQSVALGLSAALLDTDGSEAITAVSLSGLPEGFALSAGTRAVNGSWQVPLSELPALRLTAPADWNGTLGLTLGVTTRDGQSTNTTTRGFNVTLAPVNDAPALTLAAAPRAAMGQAQAGVIADAAIADVDDALMSGATITLAGAGDGESLGLQGLEMREAGGRTLLGETGIEMIRAQDGSVTLSGAAPRAVYERVLEALSLEHPGGLSAGARSIGITLRDEAGAAGNTSVVAVSIEPSVIRGDGSDRVLAGTAGHDTFHASAGDETMMGGEGADLFVVMADGSADRVEGGGGSWLDTVHVQGAGAPEAGGWTLLVAEDVMVTRGERSFDFAAPAEGQLVFADGTQVELAQIERVTW